MKKNPLFKFMSVLIFSAIFIQSCKTLYLRHNYNSANELLHKSNNSISQAPYLKAHFKNGDVCIFNDRWTIDTIKNTLSGSGTLYDFNRNVKYGGILTIPIDSIALFETNKRLNNAQSANILALAIVAGLDIGLGIFCASNPKACFGSCPTFYLNPDDNYHYCDAEGFSSSILPSFEKDDIDNLDFVLSGNKPFSLYMKNEALETHCINKLSLKVIEIENDENAFVSGDRNFYKTEKPLALSKAYSETDTCTALLLSADKNERFSLADPKNMAAKEELILEFNGTKNIINPGLLLHFRQTLMTTYIFYNTMGYMGDEVSDKFTLLETDDKAANTFKKMQDILGGIEVYLWKNGNWKYQGIFNEAGPIAINKEILKLKDIPDKDDYKIKLKLTKGFWRIDYASLTNIKSIEQPIELEPESISKISQTNEKLLKASVNGNTYMISMPGDMYKIDFTIPQSNHKHKLFLYTKGYYLEWMRQDWIQDKNLIKLKYMEEFPSKYFKSEAAAYKKYESEMEEIFWESKIDCNDFSYFDLSQN